MPIKNNGKIMLTLDDLKPIAEGNGIVDGTLGGLILGNAHSIGGIKVIRQYQKEELYEVIAEFEGWEYILNPLATAKEIKYLTKLNSEFVDTKKEFTEYEIPNGIEIIDTRPIFENVKETNKLILLNEWSQFIINKHSTKKYLTELDNLNKKYLV
jgi:ribonucleotide reductase beta subunit family protein with ferritin-like domain